jgi:methylenetetrahydrofolate dehydrogenase (NADP+)/methenyltetrahydrofolate cyclohydrolase/formyltetrahydrofolate synthetase
MEKFVNIKCRASGLIPNAVVLVATIRALKMHGGGPEVTPGKPLPEVYLTENLDILEKGCANLERHIQNAKKVGIKVIVAVNRFTADTDAEIALVTKQALAAGADAAVPCNHWAEGGPGAVELGKAVISACEEPNPFKFLYDVNLPIKEKIETVAKEFYRADGVDYSDLASEQIARFEAQNFGNLPVCMSKTALSFSGDPSVKNAPTGAYSNFSSLTKRETHPFLLTGFRVTVDSVRASVGAGFIIPMIGGISAMPGALSSLPFLLVLSN